MDAPAPGTTTPSGWFIYIKGVAFLLPALLFWIFGLVVLCPSLMEFWQHAGANVSHAQWIMNTLLVLIRVSRPVLGGVIIAFVLLELLVRGWARYRQVVVGLTIFLLNAIIIIGLTAMCIAALIAHRAISHTQ